VERSEGKRLLERPRCKWECNIKMGLQETGLRLYWIDLTQDRDTWWAVCVG
jgi:hypothetical protein